METNQTEFRCNDELMLQKLLDDELAPDANELVFHHLKGCQECSEVFHNLKDLKTLCERQLGAEDESEAPFTASALTRVADSLRANQNKPSAVESPRKSPGLWNWFKSIDLRFVVQPKFVTAVAAILIVAGGVYWLKDPAPASAAELLNRSQAADDAIRNQPDQVLKRTVTLETRIGRVADLSDVGPKSALRRRIETWQNLHHGVRARRLFDENNQLLAGEWTKADGERTIYHIGMQPAVETATDRQANTLLSPESIWLLRLAAKDFTDVVSNVSSAQVEQTSNDYVIKYERPSSSTGYGLVRATLVLSRSDLHASGQTLVVSQSDETSPSSGIRFIEYKFSETSFERRTPASVAPAVFEPDAVVLETLKTKPAGQNSPSTEGETAKGERESTPVKQPNVASSELEVDVLEKLNRVNAFQGEQLSLTRRGDGRLVVSGIVSTTERRNEIVNSLGEVARNGNVVIDVSTVAEAQTRQKSKSGAATLEDVQVAENTLPVDAELRAYFSKRGLSGDQLEKEMEQFARRVLGSSSRARSHALAAKQIAERFSPSEIEGMDAVARARWRSLIKDHTNQFSQELTSVRRELGPLFANSGVEGAADVEIANDQDIARAVKRLYEISTNVDNGLRSSFSLSSERSDASVRSQQFWRSFSSGLNLARKIASF